MPPTFFKWFLGRPGPPRTPKWPIFHQITNHPTLKPPSGRRRSSAPAPRPLYPRPAFRHAPRAAETGWKRAPRTPWTRAESARTSRDCPKMQRTSAGHRDFRRLPGTGRRSMLTFQCIQLLPDRARHRGPWKGPRCPLKGPRGPLKGPPGPLKGPRGPFKGLKNHKKS